MPERPGGQVRRETGGRSDTRTVISVSLRLAVLVVLLSVRPTLRLAAQTSPPALPRVQAPPDTAHQVGPVGALWRSLLLPGWGQAVTGRHVTGALFVAWEGTTMYMTLKAQQEANYFQASGSGNVESKRQEVQDWLVLWGFNHLFSAAEAFVAAHLRDFPKDLKLQGGPGGVGLSFPLPHR